MRTLHVTLMMCLLAVPAHAQYSGGTGEPNDPYQIATAADLIALGETPEDYDKHFILTADIDLDPNLPGRKVFDRAVIAPDTDPTKEYFQGTPFTGVFDGNGYTISHLALNGVGYLSLFGQLGGWSGVGGIATNLGVVDVDVVGSGQYVGGLVGENYGTITHCYGSGAVSGNQYVGGLVGSNSYYGSIIASCSNSPVSGNWYVGGLVGGNHGGSIAMSYSSGSVSGESEVGGLVGRNYGMDAGEGRVTHCYSTAWVSGVWAAGGLVGENGMGLMSGPVNSSFWDTETSGQTRSAGGAGKTTAEMQTANTFLDARWDFVGETANGTEDIWWILEGKDYPRLWWQADDK